VLRETAELKEPQLPAVLQVTVQTTPACVESPTTVAATFCEVLAARDAGGSVVRETEMGWAITAGVELREPPQAAVLASRPVPIKRSIDSWRVIFIDSKNPALPNIGLTTRANTAIADIVWQGISDWEAFITLPGMTQSATR
jgi:hypothetical protein